jgi:hypothetical protein
MALQQWLGRSRPIRPIENPEPFILYVVRPPVPNDASTKDIDARIAYYRQIGLEINHPNIGYKKVAAWIAHARRAAQELGLRIEAQSSCAS